MIIIGTTIVIIFILTLIIKSGGVRKAYLFIIESIKHRTLGSFLNHLLFDALEENSFKKRRSLLSRIYFWSGYFMIFLASQYRETKTIFIMCSAVIFTGLFISFILTALEKKPQK